MGSIIFLLAALTLFNSQPIADEDGHHLRPIEQFSRGEWSWPRDLPMLPTYHVLVALVCKVFGYSLFTVRACTVAMALLAIVIMHAIVRKRGESQRLAGYRDHGLLHFVWEPFLFPFMALGYTETPSLLCLVAAVFLHIRSRFGLSTIALFLACLIRHSNVVWVVFMAVWAGVDMWRQRQSATGELADDIQEAPTRSSAGPAFDGDEFAPKLFKHLWSHLAVVGLVVVFVLFNRGIAVNPVPENRAQFNIAQFYTFFASLVLLGAPIWLYRLGSDWRALVRWALDRPGPGLFISLLTTGAVWLAFHGFQNPHLWNHSLNFVRNWFLYGMDASPPIRLAVVGLFAVMAPVMVRFIWTQPDRLMLALVGLFSILYLLPHGLVDPRYYIVPVFFLNLFAQYTKAEARRLTYWYAAISAIIASYVVMKGGALGGIW